MALINQNELFDRLKEYIDKKIDTLSGSIQSLFDDYGVKDVADNIDAVKNDSDNIDHITNVSDNMSDIGYVADNLDTINGAVDAADRAEQSAHDAALSEQAASNSATEAATSEVNAAISAQKAFSEANRAESEADRAEQAFQETFPRSEFVTTSTGSGDAGKPIVLNSAGHVDNSMIDLTSTSYQGAWTPSSGSEYPDTTGTDNGAYWIVQGLSGDYTFQGGDLAGKTATNGDYMIVGANGWDLIHSTIDSSVFYMLDGSQAITAPFAGGGQQLKNIANGTESKDAVTKSQLDTKVSKSGDTMTGALKINGVPAIVLGEDSDPDTPYPVLTGWTNQQRFKVEAYVDGSLSESVLDLDLSGPQLYTNGTDLKIDGHIVWHEGNVDPVDKAGDTMTGTLNIDETAAAINLTATDHSYIRGLATDGSGGWFVGRAQPGLNTVHLGSYLGSVLALPEGGGAYIDDNTVWHAGNDGEGSGLEPDLATSTRIGGIKTRYDANTNTLYIRDDGQDA